MEAGWMSPPAKPIWKWTVFPAVVKQPLLLAWKALFCWRSAFCGTRLPPPPCDFSLSTVTQLFPDQNWKDFCHLACTENNCSATVCQQSSRKGQVRSVVCEQMTDQKITPLMATDLIYPICKLNGISMTFPYNQPVAGCTRTIYHHSLVQMSLVSSVASS